MFRLAQGDEYSTDSYLLRQPLGTFRLERTACLAEPFAWLRAGKERNYTPSTKQVKPAFARGLDLDVHA